METAPAQIPCVVCNGFGFITWTEIAEGTAVNEDPVVPAPGKGILFANVLPGPLMGAVLVTELKQTVVDHLSSGKPGTRYWKAPKMFTLSEEVNNEVVRTTV